MQGLVIVGIIDVKIKTMKVGTRHRNYIHMFKIKGSPSRYKSLDKGAMRLYSQQRIVTKEAHDENKYQCENIAA
jgi:hypothetical protein